MGFAELFLQSFQENILFIIIAAVIITLILFRDKLKDLLLGTLYETVVDGGLSFADEIIGIGLIPGLDIGDYIAAIMIMRRNFRHAGLIAAIFGGLEAANWIIGSFIPGVDWFFNIVPIYPLLKVISCVISLIFPNSIVTNGSQELADKEKKDITNLEHALVYIQNDEKSINSIHKSLDNANSTYDLKKYLTSYHKYKKLHSTIKNTITQSYKNLLNECYKMDEFLFTNNESYKTEQYDYSKYKIKEINDYYGKKDYRQALIELISLHNKLANKIELIEQHN